MARVRRAATKTSNPSAEVAADPLGRDAIERLLRDALDGQRVAEVAADLLRPAGLGRDAAALDPGAVALARSVAAACDAAAVQATAARDRCVATLRAAGVAARSPEPGPLAPRQLPGFELEVDPGDVDAAVGALLDTGHRTLLRHSPGALRAHLRTRAELALVSDPDGDGDGGPATRLVVRWGAPPRRVPGVLVPTDADLAAVHLPARAWPLACAVRPLRAVARRLGRASPRPAGPFLGTPPQLVGPLLSLVGLTEGDLLVDLGCGDGRVLVAAATGTGCRARGVERDPALVDAARRRARAAGVDDRVEVRHGDVEGTELTDATAVFLFLPPALLRRFLPVVLSRLPPGAAVVAHEQLALDPPVAPERDELVVAGASITRVMVWRAG